MAASSMYPEYFRERSKLSASAARKLKEKELKQKQKERRRQKELEQKQKEQKQKEQKQKEQKQKEQKQKEQKQKEQKQKESRQQGGMFCCEQCAKGTLVEAERTAGAYEPAMVVAAGQRAGVWIVNFDRDHAVVTA
jgi:hypothetical protein